MRDRSASSGTAAASGTRATATSRAGSASPFDRRRPQPLTPTTRTVIATDAITRLLEAGQTSITVTVVPVVRPSALATAQDAEDVLHFQQVALLTYDP
jgi:hypothetical protein